ncbi:sensor histidine kinase [Roseateles cellulosilyticus]|uniref:histidine kinase n=1 Tax=Pelomonas cellulosilytica TaxID=2906762 RepID=A0ABS8Y4H1_9BURK|nr:ATP-binding protein [Pelomonas sp. P8]MCE4558118.1 ATP-binding protein [Pelomonas sp. P8]
MVDVDRLTQLLVNLLGNAFKFTPPHGHVTLRVWRDGGHERLQVADTGIGNPASQLERVFEPFYTGAGSGGMGLGLAVVRQVAAAHGGWVRAESAGLNAGATFTVELPA